MQEYRDIFKLALEKQKNDPKWNAGDFIGIKSITNSNVGAVGQEFIEGLCGFLKIPFEFPLNTKSKRASRGPWDIKINNITFELKTASEDIHNSFQFNHIRYHRDYQAILCLGVAPHELYFNIWSKADLLTKKAGNLVSMEKNANASYKLTKTKLELMGIDQFEEKINEFSVKYKQLNP